MKRKRFLIMEKKGFKEEWEGRLASVKEVSKKIDMSECVDDELDIYYLAPDTGVPRPINIGPKYVLKEDEKGHTEELGADIYVGNLNSEEYEVVGTATYTDH